MNLCNLVTAQSPHAKNRENIITPRKIVLYFNHSKYLKVSKTGNKLKQKVQHALKEKQRSGPTLDQNHLRKLIWKY